MLATRLEVKDYMAMLFTALRNIAAAPRRRAQSLEPFSDCTGPCSHSKKSTAIVTHGVFDDYSAFGRLSLRKYSYRDGLGGSHYRSPYTEPAHRNDEGYLSTGSSSASDSTRPNYHLPSISAGFGLHHNQFQLHSSTETFFDMKNKRALVKRFDTKGPGPHLNASSTSSTSDTFLRLSGDIPVPPLSVPTSLPLHFKRSNFLDTQTPSSALSEPAIASRSGISLAVSSRRNNSDNALPHNHEAHEMEMKENNPAKRLRIEDPMRAHYD
ncbi:hypothetical protein CTAM01_17172, partial [Colletotrichum tamarilloi]